MLAILHEVVTLFLVAFGIIVGGSLAGGVAATFSGNFPLQEMKSLASQLKLWGAVAALGGTFYTIKSLESGLSGLFLEGQVRAMGRQVLLIASAYSGAQLGYLVIRLLAGN